MRPEELVPGICEEDLKAMQKPPMRSFDPAILQVLTRAIEKNCCNFFHEHVRKWRCQLWHSSSLFKLKPRFLPVNQRPKVTVIALCQGAKCVPNIWGVRLLSYAWTLSLLNSSRKERKHAPITHAYRCWCFANRLLPKLCQGLPIMAKQSRRGLGMDWSVVADCKLKVVRARRGLWIGMEWDNLACVTYNVWSPSLFSNLCFFPTAAKGTGLPKSLQWSSCGKNVARFWLYVGTPERSSTKFVKCTGSCQRAMWWWNYECHWFLPGCWNHSRWSAHRHAP